MRLLQTAVLQGCPFLNVTTYTYVPGYHHRDRTRASTLLCFCFCLFFSSFEHVKSLLIMGPNNTKNSSKSVIFSYLTMNNIVRIFFLIVKNTKFDQETVSLLCAKTKSWAHKQLTHINFKWGNIFAGICTLVWSLWLTLMFLQLSFYTPELWETTADIPRPDIRSGTKILKLFGGHKSH